MSRPGVETHPALTLPSLSFCLTQLSRTLSFRRHPPSQSASTLILSAFLEADVWFYCLRTYAPLERCIEIPLYLSVAINTPFPFLDQGIVQLLVRYRKNTDLIMKNKEYLKWMWRPLPILYDRRKKSMNTFNNSC